MPTKLTFYRRAILTILAVLSLALPVVAASLLKIDPAKSSIGAVFKQMNVPVEAKFKKFNAQISYDNVKPENSKANIEIDIASFDLGDPEPDDTHRSYRRRR